MDPGAGGRQAAASLQFMKKTNRSRPRILALDPSSKGFGFVVLEGANRLVDWGVVYVAREEKNSGALRRIRDILGRYVPALVLLEDIGRKECRRSQRVRDLIHAIEALAADAGAKPCRYSRDRIRKAFAPSRAFTQAQIALIVASRFPELRLWLPPRRKPWMTQDPRMSLFNAASLALTHLHHSSKRRRSA